MKIATWNVNGIKARIAGLTAWLKDAEPDVVCLQEIKSEDRGFPAEDLESLGYNVAVHGQKGFHGVALLSKRPFDEVEKGLPGDRNDTEARYVEAVVPNGSGIVRVASLYLPNGNPIGGERFDYKLKWMKRLNAHAKKLLALEEPFVLAGDYNVIPTEGDVHDPAAWAGDALFQPESRSAFRALIHLGLTDAIMACDDSPGQYTFWDYQAGAWQKNNGIRIDHLLLSPQAADRLKAADIDKRTRTWEKPSDHVPVWIELAEKA